MKDPCGYTPRNIWYIPPEDLTNDQKIALRKIHAEKISKIQAVLLTAITLIVSGIFIRYFEMQYIEISNPNTHCDALVKIEEMTRNINSVVFKNYDIARSEYKICRDVQYKITDIHARDFPDQYRNAFGRSYSNTKRRK